MDDVFRGYGIEVKLKREEDFLLVKETLTRIGVTSRRDNKLYQTAHLLHKRGYYAIVHFKELFAFDGRRAELTEEDVGRRNTIVKLLSDWNLLEIIDKNDFEKLPKLSVSQIKIIPFKDKDKWELITKYKLGKKLNKY